MKAQPEGNGTMFDNTMVMYFPEGGETHHGTGTEAPFLILSGKNCNMDIAGRYTRLPYHAMEGHRRLTKARISKGKYAEYAKGSNYVRALRYYDGHVYYLSISW